MTALGPVLESLGLSQYLERFVAEGFDTWETLQDITEADL
jgi:NADPH-dependent 7-cyano-7-deazaguanine reductase QueF-like protein